MRPLSLPDAQPIAKVLAYITRHGPDGVELLVFEQEEHPEAGLQVPGGTVDAGETLVEALRREVAEESGLVSPEAIRFLAAGPFIWEGRSQLRHFFHLAAPAGLPDGWRHVVTAGEEDEGLVFVYRWLPRAEAMVQLVNEQGGWLHLLAENGIPPGPRAP